MILITGASGHVGSRIGKLLTEQGQPIRLMTRNIDKVPDLKGAEVVIADYNDPVSLNSAFAGIDTAFIVSLYGKQGERAKLHKSAIETAAVARVNHIVYLSFQGASPDSKIPYGTRSLSNRVISYGKRYTIHCTSQQFVS